MTLGGAGDRHDPRLLREKPSERDLRWGRAFGSGEMLKHRDESLVRAERLRTEARNNAPEVVLSEGSVGGDRAGEETLTERTERDKADAQGFQGRQDFLFRLAPPERILTLKGCHGLNGMSPADRLRAGLRQAEVLDLSLADEVSDRSDHVLNRHIRVDAVLVIEVDRLHPQALQRPLRGLPDPFRPAGKLLLTE